MKRYKQRLSGLLMALGMTAVLPAVADEVVATAAGGWFAVDSRAVKDTTLAGGVIVGGATDVVLQSSPDAWGETGGGESATITWQSTSGNSGKVAEATTASEVVWTPEAPFGTITLTYVSGSVEKAAQFAVLQRVAVGDDVNAFIGGDGVCTIAGAGDMSSSAAATNSALWAYRDSISRVVIGAGVTGIGTNAFAYMTGLKDVSIGDSVTNIAENAFFRCAYVTNLVVGAGVTSVGSNAFNRCFSLESFTFGSKAVAEACQDAYKVVARITMDGENNPVVDTVPDVKITGFTKTLKGKAYLTDEEWKPIEDPKAIPSDYHFFKYEYVPVKE